MDIFDIITEPPVVTSKLTIDDNMIGYVITGATLLLTVYIIIYSRRFISICSLNLVSALLRNNTISYKDFAYVVAKILCFRHRTKRVSKEDMPLNGSKKKHYLWIELVDMLNEVRYGREVASTESNSKLHKIALKWLRQS